MSLSWYRTNTPRIIAEIIDGEAIAIDSETGTYFSLQDTGGFVWQLLTTGARLTDIVQAVHDRYQCTQTEIEPYLERFLIQLEAEKLAVHSEEAPENSAEQHQIRSQTPADHLPFTPPKLDRYEDMQEFLLIDPIHEVSEDGWPSRND